MPHLLASDPSLQAIFTMAFAFAAMTTGSIVLLVGALIQER